MKSSVLLLPLQRLIATVESTATTLEGTLAAIGGIVFIRYLLEGLSSRSTTGFLASDASTLVHYSLFYVAIFLGTASIFSIVSKTHIEKTSKIALFGLLAVWIAPTIDLIFFGGYPMGYLFIGPHELFTYFLSYFGPLSSSGITPGMRIELTLVFIGAGVYAYIKTHSLVRALLAMVCLYTFVFISVALPSVLLAIPTLLSIGVPSLQTLLNTSLLPITLLHPGEALSAIVLQERLFNAFISQVLLIGLPFLTIVWFYLWNPQGLRAFVGNIRITRLIGYLLLVLFGALIAPTPALWKITLVDSYTFITAGIAIVAAWVFAVATNDLVDEEIDAVSNVSRPLIQGTLSRETMRAIAIVAGLYILCAGIALGSYSLFFLLTYTAAYYIYSTPPLRLKRVPGLASLLVSFACLSAILFGYYVVSVNRVITDFPLSLALLVLIFFTIAVNFKDLKDIEGDRQAGIITIATLLGQKRARFVLGAMLTGALTLTALFLPLSSENPLLAWSGVAACAVVWAGMVRGFGERFLFIVFLLYTILIGTILLTSPSSTILFS